MESKSGAPAETITGAEVEVSYRKRWLGGILGGLVGGFVMGLLMVSQMPGAVEAAIPALWGQSGAIAGWGIHLFNSVIFGLLFAVLLALPAVRKRVEMPRTIVAAGLLYGAALWLIAAGIVMPLWLSAVGFGGAPPLPNLTIPSLIGHLAYGLLLGGVYVALTR